MNFEFGRNYNATEYIDRHLEYKNLTKWERPRIEIKVNRPIGGIGVEMAPNLIIEVQERNLQLKCSLIKLQQGNVDDYDNVIEHIESESLDLSKILIVKDLSLIQVDTYKEVNFHQLLPAGYRILLLADDQVCDEGYCWNEEKICLVRGNILLPHSLISLAHEIGHARDCAKMTQEQLAEYDLALEEFDDSLDKDQLALILRMERNAWAFAIRIFKPFMPDLIVKEDFLNLVHRSFLYTYSLAIKQRLRVINRNGIG